LISPFANVEASEKDNSSLYNFYLVDPGHSQKRGKDKSVLEAYYGMQPSLALKYNFSHKTAVTESAYFMMGMDFDSDMFAKIGVVLNPGKKNKNLPTLPNPDGRVAVLFKAWRYVMLRQALEFGYRGHFLDTEETIINAEPTPGSGNNWVGYTNDNYGGLTFNYTLLLDGNFLFDKSMWYIFDHRTARRIRLKFDAGLFFNLSKFNQHDLDFLSGSNSALTEDGNFVLEENVDELNIAVPEDDVDFNQPLFMRTYPVLTPFFNFSIGFAF
jgi:hypothetical protein